MSIASQDVYLNLTTPISVIGSGGGGGGGSAITSTLELYVSTVKPLAGTNRIDFVGDPAASLLRLNFSTVNTNTLLGNVSQFNTVKSAPTNPLNISADGDISLDSGGDTSVLTNSFEVTASEIARITGITSASVISDRATFITSSNVSVQLDGIAGNLIMSSPAGASLNSSNSCGLGTPSQYINMNELASTFTINSTAPVKFSAVGINLGVIQNTTYGPTIGTVTISSINTSSISGVPVFTLAQYQALSTLAA